MKRLMSAGSKLVVPLSVVTACVMAAVGTAQATPVPVGNPGFENLDTGSTPFGGWGTFGPNVYRERVNARTGDYSCKIFQNFSGQPNFSGVFQNPSFAATPGDVLVGKMWAFNASNDAMRGGNSCVLKFDYKNTDGQIIGSSDETVMLNAASPQDVYTEFTVQGTVPAGAVDATLVAVFIGDAVFSGGAAFLDDASVTQNGSAVALPGASFESTGGGTGWSYFRAAARDTQLPRTGLWQLYTTGDPGNTGAQDSGAFQDLPVTAGLTYTASVWAGHFTASGTLGGVDSAEFNWEWLNAGRGQISVDIVSAVNPSTPVDAYQLVTNTATAPTDAAFGRLVLKYNRYGSSFPGASPTPARIFWDDVSVEEGTPPPACLADVNLDGVVDGGDFTVFINSFGVGDPTIDPAADVNLDGVVDGNDFVAFINAFGAGC